MKAILNAVARFIERCDAMDIGLVALWALGGVALVVSAFLGK